GTLNYAGSFYQNSSPATQGDVGGTGSENVLYADGTECMADYEETVYGNQGSILLPVELTMLYGICKNGGVELHWQTASESNNEGFVILRSFDGVNFEEIAEVMGAGTSTGTINYMYVDEDDKTGMVYYKLRQVDFDGKTKESKIVAVQTCGPNAQFAIAEDEITVSFKNPEETNYVVVTSLSGKIVFSKSFKDVAEARIASPRVKGVYIISVIDSKQITSEKFIK
ncbi:MAG: T9SS type A sorting domain-containing protein, partial [Bacteroidales bacterium]|nr:T9SS type A sorting domain-containing protein [Bacteroidales bacterium]